MNRALYGYVVALAAASLVVSMAMVLAGCSGKTEQVPVPVVQTAPCEIMQQHLPQVVRTGDTRETKVDALHRNEAWQHACPDTEHTGGRGRG